ncbi:MAG: ABC-2 family transporter protein [Elusimicrobiota bacterium]|nr:MAG: ABC-2 family transporter protein [Elusimicrobiota bacterium]
MRTYWVAYQIALQETLQRRSTLLMDRVGGFAIVVSLYSFWTALIGDKATFLGYTREEMLTYVLALNVLRSFVFTGRGWQLVGEISSGKISSYLVRPLSYHGYALALDLAQKTVHVCASFIEVGLLALLVRGGLFLPSDPATWLLFGAAVLMSSLLFFFLEFMISSLAFWTSESGGPLFCFELFLQFAAGAFFPLDVLPEGLRRALEATPFPYMIYFPVRVFLEKVPTSEALSLLGREAMWLAAVYLCAMAVWRRGVRSYAAEGG